MEDSNAVPRLGTPAGNIKDVYVEEQMKSAYIDYAMSVIVGRAMPDIRDGLKPVHRRILHAMNEMGIHHNKPYKKCARIVGEVLGKYHPHGDIAVYDALVRMAQDFSMRYPLIDGQGNFGSVDGDPPAAMRYTEARMSKITQEVLEDIEKETVRFVPNFDGSLDEPTILPAKIPNLLMNGSSGIAVGMATNMPPHNLSEICDVLTKLIDNPGLGINEIAESIKGPDFPTGGTIYGTDGIRSYYHTGRGKITVGSVTETETIKNKECIIVKEIPYQVNKAQLIKSIAELVNSGKISGISDIRDESDRKGMRVVITLKKGMSPEIVLNQLNKHTQMQVTFGVIMLVLIDGKPMVLNIKDMFGHFIKHRKEIITLRTKFDLKKNKERIHILEGLVIALGDIDAVIKTVKDADNVDVARANLVLRFGLSEIQANAILDMKIQRLTGLERKKIEDERIEVSKKIAELEGILSDEKKVFDIIKQETEEIKKEYGDERRTRIVEGYAGRVDDLDLIPEEQCFVTITNKGYIKRMPTEEYRSQHRGGTGVVGAKIKEEEYIETSFIASTHQWILFFTNDGRVHWLQGYQIPKGSRIARGIPMVNLLSLGENEKVTSSLAIDKFDDAHFVTMITKRGVVKKTCLDAYSRPRKGGIAAISLKEGDFLESVILTDGSKKIVIATRSGRAVVFDEKDVRVMGRTAGGVRGIRLKGGDEVIGAMIADKDTLFTITENGFGKRTKLDEYRMIRRGGQGVLNIKTSQRNGKVVAIKPVSDSDELVISTMNGVIIRIKAGDISCIGRNTQGVRIIRLKEGDSVSGVALIEG